MRGEQWREVSQRTKYTIMFFWHMSRMYRRKFCQGQGVSVAKTVFVNESWCHFKRTYFFITLCPFLSPMKLFLCRKVCPRPRKWWAKFCGHRDPDYEVKQGKHRSLFHWDSWVMNLHISGCLIKSSFLQEDGVPLNLSWVTRCGKISERSCEWFAAPQHKTNVWEEETHS